jgi:hypothetical protein
MFSYNFSNSDNHLVNTLIGCGSMFSPSLDGNKYSMGNNGCNPYIQAEMGYDQSNFAGSSI